MALSCSLPDTDCRSPSIPRLLAAPALAPWPAGGEEGGDPAVARVHLGWRAILTLVPRAPTPLVRLTLERNCFQVPAVVKLTWVPTGGGNLGGAGVFSGKRF